MFGKKKVTKKKSNTSKKVNSAKRKKKLKEIGSAIGVIGWEIYKAKKRVK